MAIAIVGSPHTNSSRPGTTCAVTFSATAGSLLVAVVLGEFVSNSAATFAISDTITGSWGGWAVASELGSSQFSSTIFRLANVAGGSRTITSTCSDSGATCYQHLVVLEFSGAATSPDNQENAATATSTTCVTGAITNTAGDVVVAAMVTNQTSTMVTNYGIEAYNAASTSDVCVSYAIEASSGSREGNWTSGVSANYFGCIASFLEASGGGGGLVIPVAMAQYRQRWA